MAILGIDLGTTNSAMAVHRSNGPQIVPDGQNNDTTPSVIGIDPKTRERKVGEHGRALLAVDPGMAVEEIKRKMGMDEHVRLGSQSFLPQEISAMILRHLKEAAEDRLGEPVEGAVITVPANFPDTARQATRAAGEIAGLRVERIINEPTAAALAYGHDEGIEEEVIMVYDLGGGTFDVSIVEYVGHALDVLASAGDPHLGGKDFDRLLAEHVADQFTASEGVAVDLDPSQGQFFRLLHACERAKIELSFNVSTSVHLPFFTVKDGQPVNLDVEVTRAKFEQLIGPMIDRTERSINRALKDAGMSKSDVDRVILVGGSTRIPYVRALVERVIGRKPKTDIDPDRAVALGAAVQASIIEGSGDRVIMDVVPCSLGTATLARLGDVAMPGQYTEIIPPNTKMLKPFAGSFATVVDDQEVINFRVYQRDISSQEQWAEVEDEPNTEGGFHLLGSRKIKVPPGPAGQEVRTTYTYNLDGIVEVEIEFERSDEPLKFEVTQLQSTEGLNESKQRVEQLWQESEYYDDVRATLHAADRKLSAGLGESDRVELEALVQALKQALAQENGEEVRRLEGLLTDLLFDLED